jgi:hypothetical protein
MATLDARVNPAWSGREVIYALAEKLAWSPPNVG